MKGNLFALIICMQAFLFCQEPSTIKLSGDSAGVKNKTDIIRLKAESRLIGKNEFSVDKEKQLRPIGRTILVESLIAPLVGLGAGLAGGVIGLATAPGKTNNQHHMGGSLETQQNAAAGLGFIIGYSLGTGIGGYLIAKDGYPKSSIWFSTFASVLGECVGAAIFSAFDNEPYTLLIPVITPVVFTVLLNHIYGTF